MKKIMLIHPPVKVSKYSNRQCTHPLGILYLAAVLKEAKHNVKVLDAVVEDYYHEEKIDDNFLYYGMSFEGIKKEIEKFSPDFVGISFLVATSFLAVQRICKMVKQIDKDIVTLTGGSHPTFLAKECMEKIPELDFITLGESEYTIRDIVNGKDLKDIEGVVYRENKEIITSPKLKFIENLDKLPFPARELIPVEKYFKINVPHGVHVKHRRGMPVMTSRGCPSKCIFCSSGNFWGNRYRGRTAENVLDEIEMLVKTYGIKEIQFMDDNLTLDRERARNIFQGIIDRKLDIAWCAPNGIAMWVLDEQLLDLMKSSGCYSLLLSIDSGNQDFLTNFIKKPLILNRVEKLTKLIKSIGIETHACFIVGFPEETMEQIEDTFRFARKINVDSVSFFVPSPLAGTELYELSKKKGYLKKGFSFENIDFTISSYKPSIVPSKYLEARITREFIKFNLSLLIRNPKRFISKFGKIIINNPINSIKRIKNLLLRSINL